MPKGWDPPQSTIFAAARMSLVGSPVSAEPLSKLPAVACNTHRLILVFAGAVDAGLQRVWRSMVWPGMSMHDMLYTTN